LAFGHLPGGLAVDRDGIRKTGTTTRAPASTPKSSSCPPLHAHRAPMGASPTPPH